MNEKKRIVRILRISQTVNEQSFDWMKFKKNDLFTKQIIFFGEFEKAIVFFKGTLEEKNFFSKQMTSSN